MNIYAFFDTNVGYFQGTYEAASLEEAFAGYAKNVGLIEEIDLSHQYATVTPEQRSQLDNCDSCDIPEEILKDIVFHGISDHDARGYLNFSSVSEKNVTFK